MSIVAALLLCSTTATFAQDYVNSDVNSALTEMLQQADGEASVWDSDTFGFDLSEFPEATDQDNEQLLDQMQQDAQKPSTKLDQKTVETFSPFFQEFELSGGTIENSSCKILKPTIDYLRDGYKAEDVIGGIFVHEGEEPYAFLSDTRYTEQIAYLPIVCVENRDEAPKERLIQEEERPLFSKK